MRTTAVTAATFVATLLTQVTCFQTSPTGVPAHTSIFTSSFSRPLLSKQSPHILLATSINDNDNDNDEDNEIENENTNGKGNNIGSFVEDLFDPIISSPLFANFLFITPFVANPTLRARASNFYNTNFDPTIATPAACVAIVGAVVYLLHSGRVMDVDLARGRTEDSLRVLREVRAIQLGAGDSSSSDQELATEAYESALREELELRRIAPSIRIPGLPGDHPSDTEEHRSAVRQFLRLEITENGDLITME